MTFFWTGVSGALLRNQRLGQVSIDYRKFVGDGFEFESELKAALSGSTVVHSAALVGEANCRVDRSLTQQVNVEGVGRLAEKCAESGVKRFVYISTSHVYAPLNQPIRESDEVHPRTIYAESKLQGENVALNVGEESDMNVAVFRLFSFLGEASVATSFAGLLARIIEGSDEKIRFADDVRDFQTPQQYWTLINVLLRSLDQTRIVNVASGIGMSVRAAAELFAAYRGRPLDPSVFEGGSSEVPFLVANISKFREITGLDPSQLDFTQ